MWLHKIEVDPRGRESRRDLADPYQMHSTLTRAFCEPDRRCLPGTFLWRAEPEIRQDGVVTILVQSAFAPNWLRIGGRGWFAYTPSPGLNLWEKLRLEEVANGERFRFRLRANPSVTRAGKREGLMQSS